jgi:hypothetical protein
LQEVDGEGEHDTHAEGDENGFGVVAGR